MTVEKTIADVLAHVEKLKKQKADLLKLTSSIDKQINDHYHIIELVSLNASQLSKVTKSLKDLLKQRREAKENLNAVSNFLSGNLENAKTPETMKKNANDRENKYRAEAVLAFNAMFK